VSGDPRHAAYTWVQTAGVRLLELLDRRERFAEHRGPGIAVLQRGQGVLRGTARCDAVRGTGERGAARSRLGRGGSIRLEDGRTVVYLAWVALWAKVIAERVERVHGGTLEGRRSEGPLCDAVGPWGERLLRAPVVLGGRDPRLRVDTGL
jgi:hypothetical protein